MNKHVILAALEVAALFGLPLAAMAGGYVLRRRYREREPRLPYHAGTFLMGAGAVAMIAVVAIVLMMLNW